ncbi:MAG: class I SAM-dependent methyltransferase, partial [Gemmatimonadota bacterium]|nr:class I SAM-dependent methyltransferase [Gemmatimonadota bacterium]
MKKKSTVDPEWWKHIFDDIYLITDARSICNERLTRFEADIFEHFLEAGKEDPILDLCGGQGRHSIEFARRGYTNITTLDYSAFLLRLGRDSSLSDGVKFIRADARCVPVRENAYRSAGIFGCSFGYFSDDNENSAVLSEVHRVLVPGGRVLIDI